MGRSNRFIEALAERVLIGDGAMGTALQKRGVGFDACHEALNSRERALVRAVHEEYVAAGVDVIETNTFRGNRSHLEGFGLDDKTFEFNYRGARLARSVAGRSVFVAGSMGPLARRGPGKRARSHEERLELFGEQMNALAAGGVDLFLLETFTSLSELRAAVEAAHLAAPDLPVIAQMAFYEGHGSLTGHSIGSAVEALLAAGADGVGVNCGRGFADALAVVEQMAPITDAPISAFPNAGLPDVREGRLVYDMPAAYMAEMALRMADAGANLIGGCCGTDATAIAAVCERVRGRPPAARVRRAAPAAVPAAPRADAEPAGPDRPGFLAHLGREPLVVVELDPPRGLITEKVVEGARMLAAEGAHLISMAENPLASVRMGNVGMAYLVKRDAGAEPLVHFTGRDRNAIGLHSDLMGASALGIRHVLAVTGDPAGPKDGGVTSVYDVNSIGLCKIITALNEGHTAHGVDLGRPAGFTLGVAFNPNFRTMDGQVTRLREKVDAGAHFALSQLVFDSDRIREIPEAVGGVGVPVLPGIMPVVSHRNALFMKHEVPGVQVPDEVIAAMEAHPTGEDARKVGLDIARTLVDAALASGAPGVYIVAPFNRADLAAELVRQVRAFRPA